VVSTLYDLGKYLLTARLAFFNGPTSEWSAQADSLDSTAIRRGHQGGTAFRMQRRLESSKVVTASNSKDWEIQKQLSDDSIPSNS